VLTFPFAATANTHVCTFRNISRKLLFSRQTQLKVSHVVGSMTAHWLNLNGCDSKEEKQNFVLRKLTSIHTDLYCETLFLHTIVLCENQDNLQLKL
jgi:hypothetical protein